MNPNPNINPQEILPLYLSDQISLSDAVHAATATPKKDLLRLVLQESKSLPRETDTHPTSPTPDLPSAPQEKLLSFAREYQSRVSGSEAHDESGFGVVYGTGGSGYEAKDKPNGEQNQYHLNLNLNNEQEDPEDEFTLVREIIRHSVPRPYFSPSLTSEERSPGPEDLFDSGSATTSRRRDIDTTSEERRRRRRSSIRRGEALLFYNLISFLAFLTKENLLLSPGVGESIISGMVHDTLAHPGLGSGIRTQNQGQHQEDKQGQERTHHASYTTSYASVGLGLGGDGEVGVTAISLWLVIMGEELYDRISRRQHEQERGSRDGCGCGLDRGDKSTLILRNWETYITRLRFLSLYEDLSISAREQAAEAAAVMSRVF